MYPSNYLYQYAAQLHVNLLQDCKGDTFFSVFAFRFVYNMHRWQIACKFHKQLQLWALETTCESEPTCQTQFKGLITLERFLPLSQHMGGELKRTHTKKSTATSSCVLVKGSNKLPSFRKSINLSIIYTKEMVPRKVVDRVVWGLGRTMGTLVLT